MAESSHSSNVQLGMIARLTFASVLLCGLAAPVCAQDTHGWNELLEAHVSAGRVDYAALAEPEQRKKLRAVVDSYAGMPESAALADWINAYNAAVVWGVVEHYPIKSVMDVDGFFKNKHFRIAGQSRTLDEIEHRVIRPKFKDARVHAALNCAALSCPPLHGHAFRRNSIDETLAMLTQKWLQDDRHVTRAGDVLKVSEIFLWFEEDFKREASSIQAWIVKHAPARKSMVEKTSKIAKMPYDWRLNDKR